MRIWNISGKFMKVYRVPGGHKITQNAQLFTFYPRPEGCLSVLGWQKFDNGIRQQIELGISIMNLSICFSLRVAWVTRRKTKSTGLDMECLGNKCCKGNNRNCFFKGRAHPSLQVNNHLYCTNIKTIKGNSFILYYFKQQSTLFFPTETLKIFHSLFLFILVYYLLVKFFYSLQLKPRT